ncbi:hypothetical protein LL946_14635 [Knoellia locipacati]|uniref:hypothetical protein n=1 Tax=Knoellia locipacati TaxID=882824 RepID=UPI00384D5CAF
MSEHLEERRISRRTIAKGAAWAIPAVPLVVATPAYAASGGGPTIVLGDACKLPGNSCGNVFVKGYIFDVTITNNTDKDIYLYNETGYLITFAEDAPAITLFFQAAIIATGPNAGDVVTFPYLLEPGESIALIFNAGENGNSQNVQDITVTISVPWGHTEDPNLEPDNHPPAVDTATYPSTPPEQNPNCQVFLPPDCG